MRVTALAVPPKRLERRVSTRLFVAAAALALLAFEIKTAKLHAAEFEQRGPWFVQESHNAQTGAPEYFAMTPSLEDQNFWIAFSCLADKRVYLSLGKTKGKFSGAMDQPFLIEIRLDRQDLIIVEAKSVSANMMAINPQTSKAILVGLIHSNSFAVLISSGSITHTIGHFGVQPSAPALGKILDACEVATGIAPSQSP